MCSIFSLFSLVVHARVAATHSSGAASVVCGRARAPQEGNRQPLDPIPERPCVPPEAGWRGAGTVPGAGL